MEYVFDAMVGGFDVAMRFVIGLLGILAFCACEADGSVPRCDGATLIRACTERECVEGGYTEGDGRVHQPCTSGACVEADDTAECVVSPLEACTHDTCAEGWRVACGATGYVTGLEACDNGRTCSSGADWAACSYPDAPCTEPGAYFCAGDTVYGCGDHGVASTRVDTCTGGKACVSAGDQTFCGYAGLACPATAARVCREGQVHTCAQGTGLVVEKTPCEAGFACVEFDSGGTTEAECADPEQPCEPGASTCAPGALVVCGGSGYVIARIDCETCEEPEDGRAECR